MYISIQVMLYIIYITTHLWRSNFLIPFEIPTLEPRSRGAFSGRAGPLSARCRAAVPMEFQGGPNGTNPMASPGFFSVMDDKFSPRAAGETHDFIPILFFGGGVCVCVCVFLGCFFLEEWWFLKKGSLFPAFGWRKGSSYYSVELWKPRSLSAMDLPRNQFYFLIASLESMKVGSTHVCPALLEVLSSESP